ncbi:MAG: hypothetical protein GXO64_03430 [Candidatus Micrarchaeota archaeon]|nr:hypothetical protein [Candidatus Micrarchaeota archaeon]
MGFFDFLKKEKKNEEVQEPETLALLLDDIIPLVDERLSEQLEHARTQIDDIGKDVEKGIETLKSIAKKMEKTYFEKNDKTYTRINMVKDTWLKKLMLTLNAHSPMKGTDADAVEEFVKNVQGIINEAASTDARQNYILSNYFKDEMKRFVSVMNDTRQLLERLSSFLSDDNPFMIDSSMKGMVKELKRKADERSQCKASIRKMENETRKLDEIKRKREDNLVALTKGTDMMRLTSLESAIDDARKDASALRMKLSEEISAVNRPLKKIKHDAEKGESRLIGEFLSAPLDICLSDGGERKMENIISIASKIISEKRIQISDKDAKKISMFSKKLQDGEIGKMKGKYKSILKTISGMEDEMKELEPVLRRKKSIENDISAMEAEIGSIKDEISKKKAELVEINNDIDELKDKIADYSEKRIGIRLEVTKI